MSIEKKKRQIRRRQVYGGVLYTSDYGDRVDARARGRIMTILLLITLFLAAMILAGQMGVISGLL